MEAALCSPRPFEAGRVSKLLLRILPSFSDFAFLMPIAFLFIVMQGARTLLGDADTGWHIRTGDWILQHRAVPHKDIFSFTMTDRDWFAWEWGWDVMASLVHRAWGLSGIVFFDALLLGLCGVLLYRRVRRYAGSDVWALVLTSAAICGSSFHWLARPHLLSWVFILISLDLLDRVEAGKDRCLWCLPVLTLAWVNLHGSFFLAVVFTTTWGIGATLRRSVSGINWRTCATRYFICATLCLLASFANPYGWRLHQHLLTYLADSRQLGGISEFAPLSFTHPFAIVFEFYLFTGICAAYWCLRHKCWAEAAMILLWAHLALKVGRNIPIFLFIAAPPVAGWISKSLDTIRERISNFKLRAMVGKISNCGAEFEDMEQVSRLHVTSAAAMIMLASVLGMLSNQRPTITDFNNHDFPVGAVSVLAQSPDSKIFTFDQWGDYLIYKLYPRIHVFVDGRSDLYGASFTDAWVNALSAKYDWGTELSRFSLDTILLRPSNALASVLKQSPDWKVVFDDGVAIVFRARGESMVTAESPQVKSKVLSGVTAGPERLVICRVCKFTVNNSTDMHKEKQS